MHFRVVCPQCDRVIAQCRCMDPNKSVRLELCDECRPAMADPLEGRDGP